MAHSKFCAYSNFGQLQFMVLQFRAPSNHRGHPQPQFEEVPPLMATDDWTRHPLQLPSEATIWCSEKMNSNNWIFSLEILNREPWKESRTQQQKLKLSESMILSAYHRHLEIHIQKGKEKSFPILQSQDNASTCPLSSTNHLSSQPRVCNVKSGGVFHKKWAHLMGIAFFTN